MGKESRRSRVCVYILAFAVGAVLRPCCAEPMTFSGTVTTWEGKPAAGALVSVVALSESPAGVAGDDSGGVVLGSAMADRAGAFAIGHVNIRPDGMKATRLLAFADGGGATWWSANEGETDHIAIFLPQSAPTRVTVLDDTGHPVAGARVFLTRLSESDLTSQAFVDLPVPRELGFKRSVLSNPQGQLDLTDVPQGGRTSFEVDAHGLASPRFTVPAYAAPAGRGGKSEITAQLYRPAPIRGRFRIVESGAGADVLKKNLALWWDGKVPPVGEATAKVVLEPDGEFLIRDAPPGWVAFRVHTPADSVWQDHESFGAAASGGGSRNLLITLHPEHGLAVSGRVSDAATGRPIPDAAVKVEGLAAQSSVALETRSGTDGFFQFYAPPGTFWIGAAAPGYVAAPSRGQPTAQAVSVGLWPVGGLQVRLRRTVKLQVLVKNERGEPVPGATVVVGGFPRYFSRHGLSTDAHGLLTFENLNPNDTLLLSARTATAFGDDVQIKPQEAVQPVILTVREGVGARLSGRVIDDAGQPVPGATLLVSNTRLSVPMENQRELDAVEIPVDPQGAFRTPLLWPRWSYYAIATAPHHRPASLEFRRKDAGPAANPGDLVLVRRVGVLSGRVVDQSGKPVPGARVWIPRTDREGVETVSDSDGRFRFGGLDPDPCFLFAEKKGFELEGGLQRFSSTTLTLALRPRTVQAAVTGASAARDNSAATRLLVQHLIRRTLDETAGSWDMHKIIDREHALTLLSEYDPRAAERIASFDDGHFPQQANHRELNVVRAGIALRHSVPEAMNYYRLIGDPAVREAVMLAAIRAASADHPAAAKELLREAVAAESVRFADSHPAAFLARAAGEMRRLGMPGARKILTAAARQASALGGSGEDGIARGVVAEQLSDYDLEAALTLVAPITDPGEQRKHYVNIACHIAFSHPAEARALAVKYGAQSRVAVRVGRRDVAVGEAIIATLPRNYVDRRVGAYLGIARELPASRRQQALDCIDRALEALKEPIPDANLPQLYDRALLTASVAAVAKAIGDPDAHAIALRALSLRTTPRHNWFRDGFVPETDSRLAVFLAAADPPLARPFLSLLLPRVLTDWNTYDYRGNVYWEPTELAEAMLDPAGCDRLIAELENRRLRYSLAVPLDYAAGTPSERKRFLDSFLWGSPDQDE